MIRKYVNYVLFKLKHPDCRVHPTAYISSEAVIGSNCSIGFNTSIGTNVVLGNNVKIGSGVNLKNIKIGNGTMLEAGVQVVGTGIGRIIIGEECYIGVNNILDTSDSITIGDFVHIAGPSTGLWCHSSAQMCLNSVPLSDPNRDQFRPTGPISIDSNVYIGGNCTIYPKVHISTRTIIAPNSSVNKSFGSDILVGGVPAKFIKKLRIE